jgi:hypothetical protein
MRQAAFASAGKAFGISAVWPLGIGKLLMSSRRRPDPD